MKSNDGLVLFFASDFKIGLSSLLVRQVCSLQSGGANLIVLSGAKEQESGLFDILIREGVRHEVISGLDEHHHYWELVGRISMILQREHIKVCHVQNNWQLALVSACNLRLKRRVRVLYTLHGFRNNSPVKSVVARGMIGCALLMFADKVIYMSGYVRKCFSFLGSRLVYYPRVIDDDYYLPTSRFHMQSEGIKAIFPAQFREGKNQDMLIRVVARLSKESYNLRLILPGEGDLRENCIQLAESLGVVDQVLFPGQCRKDDLLRIYKECNVAIISSNSETFGQSIVEAMATGCLLVSRPVGIAADIIEHGRNGFLFNTEKELISVLMEILAGKHDMQRIAERGKQTAELFRGKVLAKGYARIIRSLLQ